MRSCGKLSKKYDGPLTLEIKPSLFLGSVFVFLGVGAALMAIKLSLPYGLGWCLAGAVLVGMARILCLHVLGCARHAVGCLKLEASDRCAVAHAVHHPWQDCRVVGWYAHPWLVILRLQALDTGRPRDVLVAWDALAQDRFRELRVRAHGLRRPVEG